MNLKLVDLDDGYSVVEMRFTEDMENILGMAHGGAIFALIDEAFETAGNSHGTVAVALNMNITYTAAPSPGAQLRAEAREVNLTPRTATYDIRVTDEKETLIALCQALVYRKKEKLPFLE
jgi:acyl-CoA thioesterase